MRKLCVFFLWSALLSIMCAASVVLAGPDVQPQVNIETRFVEVSRDWDQRVAGLELDIDRLEGQITTVESVIGTTYDDGRSIQALGMLKGNLRGKRRALRNAKMYARVDEAHKKNKKVGSQYQATASAWQQYRRVVAHLFAYHQAAGLFLPVLALSTPQRAKVLVQSRMSLEMFLVQQVILLTLLSNVLMVREKLGGGGCFPAGVLVLMADGSYRPIETLLPGDMVLSMDRETGLTRPARVADTSTVWEPFVFELNDGLLTNGAHQFYTHEGLKPAGELEPGDVLATRTGPVELTDKDRIMPGYLAGGEGQIPMIAVYNILVEGTHTFYVSADGADSYLVHDQCACGEEEVTHDAQ